MSETNHREAVLEVLGTWLTEKGLDAAGLDENASLIDLGVVDSFGFLELLGRVEERLGVEIDFSEADPEEFTSVSGLLSLISAG